MIWPRQVISRWKPIVIYSKGNWRKIGRWSDVTQVPKDKQWHDWQQPLDEVALMARYFSQPGQLVIDPCGGAFSTAVACKRLGRRFCGCDVEKECVLKGQARLKMEEELTALALPEQANGKEYTVDVANDIPHVQCPFCKRRFPLHRD